MTAEALGTDDGGQQTRAAAFGLLLESGGAVSAAQIAAATKAAPLAVKADLRRLDAARRIPLSAGGEVLGSGGLRAAPGAHGILLCPPPVWARGANRRVGGCRGP